MNKLKQISSAHGCLRLPVSYLLIISMSGLLNLLPMAYAENDSGSPVLHHNPPMEIALGDEITVQVSAEDAEGVVGVSFWYRPSGKKRYRKLRMTFIGEETFEINIPLTSKFKNGLEYFIKATDPSGKEGLDGTQNKPYRVEAREMPVLLGLSTKSAEPQLKRPWWKNQWFWIAVLAVGGGIVAGMSALGDDKKDDKGTGSVIVE